MGTPMNRALHMVISIVLVGSMTWSTLNLLHESTFEHRITAILLLFITTVLLVIQMAAIFQPAQTEVPQ